MPGCQCGGSDPEASLVRGRGCLGGFSHSRTPPFATPGGAGVALPRELAGALEMWGLVTHSPAFDRHAVPDP